MCGPASLRGWVSLGAKEAGGRELCSVGAALHNLEDRSVVVIAAANVSVVLGEIDSAKSSSPCPAQTNSIISHHSYFQCVAVAHP